MTKTYASLLASGVLMLSGLAYAGTVHNLPLPAVTADEGEQTEPQTPYAPEIDLYFDIVDGEGVVVGTLYAPTMLQYDWMTGAPERPIEGTMTIRLVRTCYELDVQNELVKEWTDVKPDQKIEWTDKTMAIGEAWTYRAIAIVDGKESDSWNGTLGTYTGIRPLPVENFEVTAEMGSAPVTVTFTVPDGVLDADLFPDIKYVPQRVYVTRQFQAVGEWDNSDPELVWQQDNPAFNEPYTFLDDNNGEAMPEGTYSYNVFVTWQWGTSLEQSKRVGLFLDAPDTPKNIKAVAVEDGVEVTWDAVTEPKGVGFLDPESVMYDVYRYYGYNDTELVGEDIKGTSFLDNLEGIEKQMEIRYEVMAKNGTGSSPWAGTSNDIVVGPPASLPFTDTFSSQDNWGNYGYSDMLWSQTTLEGTASWMIGEKASYYDENWNANYVRPTESKGLAYTTFASYQPTGVIALTSGAIDFTGHDAGEVTFSYYTNPAGLVSLEVEILSDFDPSEGSEVSPYYAPAEGVIPATTDDSKTAVIWTGSNKGDAEGWQTATAKFDGFGPYDKIYLRFKATETEAPADGLFIPAAVQSVTLDATDEYNAVQGLDAEAVSSEYYSLQGIRLAAPVKGQPVIRRSVMPDGSVRTGKVIVK
ncbi:MAG: hypothetical protein K2O24_02135 [Muribaculaceae bacterium]|nr:hypothetical protein [Muribaculaceae bacterium]